MASLVGVTVQHTSWRIRRQVTTILAVSYAPALQWLHRLKRFEEHRSITTWNLLGPFRSMHLEHLWCNRIQSACFPVNLVAMPNGCHTVLGDGHKVWGIEFLHKPPFARIQVETNGIAQPVVEAISWSAVRSKVPPLRCMHTLEVGRIVASSFTVTAPKWRSSVIGIVHQTIERLLGHKRGQNHGLALTWWGQVQEKWFENNNSCCCCCCCCSMFFLNQLHPMDGSILFSPPAWLHRRFCSSSQPCGR